MLDQVLTLLDRLARHPAMYVHPLSIPTIQSYLRGLEAGCGFGGLPIPQEVSADVARERGWKFRATGIVWHMQDKKLTDEAIIQELIAIQAEAFRRAAAGSAAGPPRRGGGQ